MPSFSIGAAAGIAVAASSSASSLRAIPGAVGAVGGGGGGGFWTPFASRPQRDREMSIDYSRRLRRRPKKPEATTNVVVMGDAMADWLALGLEDAFSENPDIGIVRKHRTEFRPDPIRGSPRRRLGADREGNHRSREAQIHRDDGRQQRPPVDPRKGAGRRASGRGQAAGGATRTQPTPAAPQAAPDPEQQVPEGTPEPAPPPTPEQVRQGALGPFEFHTEKWEAGYIRRIDATIAALKTAGVPVIWVGLPSQRGAKASSDSSYLNELFRSRAEKAGITYVDVWDGFVDEAGRFTPQGPDYEGQTRRLRSGDGIYFTKFGARKLAHYVEREIQRHITNRAVPVALPIPVEPGTQPGTKPGRSGAAAGGRSGGAAHRGGDDRAGGADRRRPRARGPRPPIRSPPACSPRASRSRRRPAVPMISAGRAAVHRRRRSRSCCSRRRRQPVAATRRGSDAAGGRNRADQSRPSTADRHRRSGARDQARRRSGALARSDAPRPPLSIQNLFR